VAKTKSKKGPVAKVKSKKKDVKRPARPKPVATKRVVKAARAKPVAAPKKVVPVVKPPVVAKPVSAAKPVVLAKPVVAAKPAAPGKPAALKPMVVAKSVAPAKPKVAFFAPPAPLLKQKKKKLRFEDKSHVEIVPPPVPTSTGKAPGKNAAGLSAREVETYREHLLAKRRELVGDMSSMEREALRSSSGSNLSNLPLHMADMGTDNYEQEFTLGLVEKDRSLLREINQALAKIQNGMYGMCDGTGKPIGRARLDAQPWAKHSIEHARALEKHRGIR